MYTLCLATLISNVAVSWHFVPWKDITHASGTSEILTDTIETDDKGRFVLSAKATD